MPLQLVDQVEGEELKGPDSNFSFGDRRENFGIDNQVSHQGHRDVDQSDQRHDKSHQNCKEESQAIIAWHFDLVGDQKKEMA